MGLYRRARGFCPLCKKEKRADVGVKHPKVKNWSFTCNCGKKFTAVVEHDWWISFRDLEGRYKRRKIGPDKQAAERILAKVKVELAEGRYIDRKATCKVTLDELFGMYLKHIRPLRKKKHLLSEKAAWKHILEFFARGIPIDRIGEAEVEAYRAMRGKERAAIATINRELSNLSAALGWAVRKGMIDKKPIFRMPNPHNERTRFLTKDEARRIIDSCSHRIILVVQTAMFTGMRLGEILKMQWSWLDLQNKMINIPPDATKTGRGRHVPISDDMYRVLDEARERKFRGCPYVFHRFGRRMPSQSISNQWRLIVAKAGLKGFRFHDLRHAAASWLVMGGEDLHTVATILGHTSLDMTRRYAHLAPGHLRSAIKHVDIGLAQADARPKASVRGDRLLNTREIPRPEHPSIDARYLPVASGEKRPGAAAPRPCTYPTPNATLRSTYLSG